MNIFQTAKIIRKLTNEKGIYLVGGAIRDWLSGDEIYDIDFTMNKNPMRLAKKFADFKNGSFVILDDINKIYRVIVKNNTGLYTFDFTKFKGKNLAQDLSNRDFTINAMAIPLSVLLKFPRNIKQIQNAIIDPYGGLTDIKNKRIKFLSEKSILEDPLRILRAYRFSATLNYKIELSSEKMIKRHTKLINSVSAERIRDEIFKIFSAPNSTQYILHMDKSGVLVRIFPEIATLKKSARKFYFHPKGLWHHLTETLLCLEEILNHLKKYFPKNHMQISEYLNKNISTTNYTTLLKFITMVHDIGKPSCVKKIKNRVRFFGHELAGTELFEKIAQRLKLSKYEITIGKNLIKNHMRILQLVGTNFITDRATFRLMRDAGDNIILLSLLSLSDAMSYRKLPQFRKNNIKKILEFVRKLMRIYFEKKNQQPQKKIINGHILMKQLNLKPGPLIGKLLSAIEEEYHLKRIKTQKEAIRFAKANLRKYQAEI